MSEHYSLCPLSCPICKTEIIIIIFIFLEYNCFFNMSSECVAEILEKEADALSDENKKLLFEYQGLVVKLAEAKQSYEQYNLLTIGFSSDKFKN